MDEARARARLEEERDRLQTTLDRLTLEAPRDDDAGGDLASYDQHQADAGTELYERERAEGMIEDYRRDLAAVARAQQRLAAGTYGRSVESGEIIPDDRLEAVPWAERTIAEEERFAARGGAAPEYPPGDDDRTPLDRVEPDPVDLASIPMSGDHRPVVDPQEDGDRVEIDMGEGEAYHGEGGAPEVGETEDDDDAVERLYRPER